jgi:hypothetical protein
MTLSKITNPKIENRFSDCVSVKIEGSQTLEQNLSKTETRVKLFLTIRFGRHRQETKYGTFAFGLKQGVLKLKLNGCIMCEPSLYLRLNPNEKIDEKIIEECSHNGSGKISSTGGEANWNAGGRRAKETLYKPYVNKINLTGSDTEPHWNFSKNFPKNETNDNNIESSILEGSLNCEELANLKLEKKHSRIDAAFEIHSIDDLEIKFEQDLHNSFSLEKASSKLPLIKEMVCRKALRKIILNCSSKPISNCYMSYQILEI